jgi:hypothetical protein
MRFPRAKPSAGIDGSVRANLFRLKNIIITEKRVPTFVSQGISLETGGLDLLITTREAAFRAFRIQPALKKFLFVRTSKTKTCKKDSQKKNNNKKKKKTCKKVDASRLITRAPTVLIVRRLQQRQET